MAWDIVKGWPYDGALNDNAVPKDAENIIAGMAVKKHTDGELIKAVGAANERAFVAIANQAALDVTFSKSMPYVWGNMIYLTDQYVAQNYVMGENLEVSPGNPGKLQKYTAGVPPIFGVYDGQVTRDGINYIKVVLKA